MQQSPGYWRPPGSRGDRHAQQQRLLERLRDAGDQPVASPSSTRSGIAFPAAVVSELELNGYEIERVYDDHGWMVGVACSSQTPGRSHWPPLAPPPHRQPAEVHFAITADDRGCESGACSGRSTRRRRTGSPSSFARCSQAATVAPAAPRPWTGSSRPHAERTICAKLACSSHGRGPCRSQRKQYAHGPNGKVPASRQATARLRPAVPAPLPKSAADWMHARGRFPQRSRTNAATPPMIGSPRFAKSVLVVQSSRTCWSCGC